MNLFRQFLYGNRLAGNRGMSWVEWIPVENPKARAGKARKSIRGESARLPFRVHSKRKSAKTLLVRAGVSRFWKACHWGVRGRYARVLTSATANA